MADNLIGAGPFELARLKFDVSAMGNGELFAFSIRPIDSGPSPRSALIYHTPTPSDNKVETNVPFSVSTSPSGILITPVPEPSQWIMGLMMTGLVGVVSVKRFFANRKADSN
ncbi:MAG: PEP-CTERM sorting domain-containing protein, partial [Planctomycetales bacterium]|nr:PEP-CTERM sorting domain-containing protein [Planctomycetales bacterium]